MASGTAEGTAYLRYYESLRPPAQRVCDDYLAYPFMAWWVKLAAAMVSPLPPPVMDWSFEQKGKGIAGFIAVRTRMLDDFVLQQVKAGAEQYVILGAGLDSRPYRFADQLAGIKTFEVDHPLTQAVKEQRVREYFGRLPQHVNYVAIDFTRDDLLAGLKSSGFDPALTSVFTLEGVVMYLDEASVRKILSFICENSGPGSCVIFDYLYLAVLDGRIKNRVVDRMNSWQYIFNEPILSGIEEGEVEQYLRDLGFSRGEDFPPQKLYDLYLKDILPERTISDVYAIAIGFV